MTKDILLVSRNMKQDAFNYIASTLQGEERELFIAQHTYGPDRDYTRLQKLRSANGAVVTSPTYTYNPFDGSPFPEFPHLCVLWVLQAGSW